MTALLADLSGQRSNPEFQSAIVRLFIWLFLLVYIGMGAATEYYQVRMEQYYTLFSFFLVVFIALFISILIRPVWKKRQYFALFIDVAATSFSIFLTQNAVSPIFLFYIWIFVSYGTRYGKQHLWVATLASLIAYTIVTTVLGGWKEHAFEAYFFLFLLAILPIYQYSLLKKLHQARSEAEAANEARGRFLATMTHELRTPLSGIVGMANIMDETNLNQQQHEQLKAIRTSGARLQQLIGNILDFSRIDAEKLELDYESFDIRKTVEDVCQNQLIKAHEKDLKLFWDIQHDVPQKMLGDALRVSQVLMNLVGNAVKFTDKGVVRINVQSLKDEAGITEPELLIEVRDTGIGIEKEKLPTVFDPFRQVDDSSTRRFGGTGLGTAISKKLVDLMQGTIELESEVGKGSIFSVRLPLNAIDEADLVISAKADKMRHQVDCKNILVAEDDPVSAQLIMYLLKRSKQRVTIVNDGASALQEARTGKYDMVFVDLHMPQMDGIEFTRHLRKGGLSIRKLPVFALTANATEQARLESFQAGISEFLIKPLSPDSVERLLLQYN